jgi:hypothetical protein
MEPGGGPIVIAGKNLRNWAFGVRCSVLFFVK